MTQHTCTAIFEQDPTSGRYTASVPTLRCVTEADTLDEAKAMAKELFELEFAAL